MMSASLLRECVVDHVSERKAKSLDGNEQGSHPIEEFPDEVWNTSMYLGGIAPSLEEIAT